MRVRYLFYILLFLVGICLIFWMQSAPSVFLYQIRWRITMLFLLFSLLLVMLIEYRLWRESS